MRSWRELFEQSAEHAPGRDELEIRYQFGSPSRKSDLERLENHLQSIIPECLRSLLLEFNGIQIKQKYWGEDWRPLYLSIGQILGDLVDYIENSGNEMPPPSELKSVVFFAHQNGFAELYGVCIREFSGFSIGEILVLDHETGEFEGIEVSLTDFVSNPSYCIL